MTKKKKQVIKICNTCENCLPIGEGDHICDVHQVLVLDDYIPADDYYICNGADWKGGE